MIKEYFTIKELSCRCGCGLMPDERSIERLYAARLIYGKPIRITSGARCKKHNKDIGGARYSAHLKGAFDTIVPACDDYEIIKIFQSVGFTGIGISGTFIHVDDKHKKPTIWTY